MKSRNLKILIYEYPQNGVEKFPFAKEFENLGHKIFVIPIPVIDKYYSNTFLKLGLKALNPLKKVLVEKNINKRFKKVISEFNFDILIVFQGYYIRPETYEYAKKKGIKIFFWSTDDIDNKHHYNKYFESTFFYFDYFISPRKHLFDEYSKKGLKNLLYIEWFYWPEMLNWNKNLGIFNFLNEVSFIGATSERRLGIISSLKDYNLYLAGSNWEKGVSAFKEIRFNKAGYVNKNKMLNIFQETKINLNILTVENRDKTNLRNFEIPATCSFQIAERNETIIEYFVEDKEIVLYDSIEELKEKIEFYKRSDSIRNKIALNGYLRTINSDYSLKSRLKRIIKLYEFSK